MPTPAFELPVYFDARRYASEQEQQMRNVARRVGGIAWRRTWYGMKLVGPEAVLLAAMVELTGTYKLGRLRPRVSR